MKSVNPLETGVLITHSIQSSFHDLHYIISNEFLQYFYRNSEEKATEFLENLEEKSALVTTCVVLCLACSNLQCHNSVLPVTKGVNLHHSIVEMLTCYIYQN